jgi:hypothetical protein
MQVPKHCRIQKYILLRGEAARFFEGEVRLHKMFPIDPSYMRTSASKK